MALEELIAALTTAQEQATEGSASCTYSQDRSEAMVTVVREDGAEIIIVSRAHPGEAKSIVDRHNTAGEVLQALVDLRIHRHWHEEAIKLQGPEPGRTPSMVNAWVLNLMSSRDEWQTRAEKAEAELATANGYRAGISDDLRQVEDQSSGLAGELCKVVSLLDESPARKVLFGPAETDGVAYVVKQRLDRDSARVEELEKCTAVAFAFKERMVSAEARVVELRPEVARLNAGWHEANGRALEVGLERTKLKARLELPGFDRFQACDGDGEWSTFDNLAEAREFAEQAIINWRDGATSDGEWSPCVEGVTVWVAIERAAEVAMEKNYPDDPDSSDFVLKPLPVVG